MARRSWLLTVIIIAGATCVAAAVILTSLPLLLKPRVYQEAPPPGSNVPSSQDIYKAKLQQDIESLDRGLFGYSPIKNLKTGDPGEFDVEIVDVGRGPQTTIVTSLGYLRVYQMDVPTGGIVGVKAVLCRDLTCDSESSLDQPVLFPGLKATWRWQITPKSPGPAEIILRVDTYDRGSQQTLKEEVVRITGNVIPTSAFVQTKNHQQISDLTKSGVNFIVTVGSITAAIATVGGLVGWLVMKRRQRKSSNTEANPAQAESENCHAQPSAGTSNQSLPFASADVSIKMDPRRTSYNERTSEGVEIHWRVSSGSEPWIQRTNGDIETNWEAIMAVAVGSSTLGAFMQAVAAEIGMSKVDCAPKVVRASVHLMKDGERTIEAVEIETRATEAAITILFIGGELPDEARIALLDTDLTDPTMSGKILSWDSQIAAWTPSKNMGT